MRDRHHTNPTVNPARAGMILDEVMVIEAAQGKPRASGDDPLPVCVWHADRQ